MSSFPDDKNPYASGAGPGEPARTSGKAITSLVLGITSIACCTVFTGVPAIIFGALGLGDIRHSQGKVAGRGMAIAGIVTGSIGSTVVLLGTLGMLVGLLLPAVQAARTAARRSASSNNMKQIGLSVLNYHDRHHKFPAASARNEAGDPLLSWRVAILPYMDEPSLFQDFNQDEPWNGPNNQRLIAREPPCYVSPNASDREPGETNVLGIVDPDTVLTPDGGLTFRDVTDGLSKTIIAVELAGSGIAWSEPRDIPIDEFIAAVKRGPHEPGLRPLYPGGVECLFADGAVRFIPDDTPAETLRAMCTRAGGEPVTIPGMD